MKALIHSLAAALGLAATLACAAPPPRVTTVPIACTQVSRETCEIAASLGRGVNLGNMLDAPREGDWGVKLEPSYLALAADHFNTVRLPVRWSNHAARTADATLEPKFAARVDQAVDALLARGAYVILDVHHYTQISGDPPHPNETTVDPSVLDERLVNIWKQLGARYRDRGPRLIFELLNEPHGRLDGEPWNRLAAQALAAVRATNPTRAVMIGPGGYNAVDELPRLRLPADRNLIVSIHNYDPFNFTHQGIDYLAKPFPVGTPCCDAGQRRQVAEALDKAQRWSQAHGVPLHLGEFGAFEKADMASREAYARVVRAEAEKRGIGWTWWELASNFGLWSPARGEWVEPLRRALLD